MRSEHRRFRPMGAMDILDEVIDIYKSNFALLLGVAAILYVPISVINGLTTDYSGRPGRVDWATLLMIPFEAIVTGALAYGISERYLNKQVSITDCYRRILARPVLLSLICAVLIKTLIVFGPLLALMLVFHPNIPRDPSLMTPEQAVRLLAFCALAFIGFIWTFVFGVKMLLVEPALVIERKGALASIARSWKATGGIFWKSVWYLCTGRSGVRDRLWHNRGAGAVSNHTEYPGRAACQRGLYLADDHPEHDYLHTEYPGLRRHAYPALLRCPHPKGGIRP